MGGKSPVFVDSTVDIEIAARRIIWGKLDNSGQICVSPDYVLVESSVASEFVEACKRMITKMVGPNPENCEYYGRIISDANFKRLVTILEAEKSIAGVKIYGGKSNASTRYIEPTIITGIEKEEISKHAIMKEEIFGPILPVIEVKNVQEALNIIKTIDGSPLAYYPFSDDSNTQDLMIKSINGGGCMVNDVYIHGSLYLNRTYRWYTVWRS